MTVIEAKRRDEWFEFAQSNWEAIAAFAWENYRKFGRGEVYIDTDIMQLLAERSGVSPRDLKINPCDWFLYFGQGFLDEWWTYMVPWPVKGYDPEKQVVVTLEQRDCDSYSRVSRVLGRTPGPREAYEKLVAGGERREEERAADPDLSESAGAGGAESRRG